MAELPTVGDWGSSFLKLPEAVQNILGIINPDLKYQNALKKQVLTDPNSAQALANLGSDNLIKLFGKGKGTDALTNIGVDANTAINRNLAPVAGNFAQNNQDSILRAKTGLPSALTEQMQKFKLDLDQQLAPYEVNKAKLDDTLNSAEGKIKLDALNNNGVVQGVDLNGLVQRMYDGKLTAQDNVALQRINNTPGTKNAFNDLISLFEKKTQGQLETRLLSTRIAEGKHDEVFKLLGSRVDDTRQEMQLYKSIIDRNKLSTADLAILKADTPDTKSPVYQAALAKQQQLNDATTKLTDAETRFKKYDGLLNNLVSARSGVDLGDDKKPKPNPDPSTTLDDSKLQGLATKIKNKEITLEGLRSRNLITPADAIKLGKILGGANTTAPDNRDGKLGMKDYLGFLLNSKL